MSEICKASLTDVPELHQLINSAYRGDTSRKGWTTEADLLDGSRIDEGTLAGYFKDSSVSILKYTDDEGLIKGCVYLQKHQSKIYLGMLTVDPDLQNAGIGKLLLTKAERYAWEMNCGVMWMTVISCRHELIAYYERKGFRLTGKTRPFPTEAKFGIQKQPLELVVMEKKIT